MSRLNKNKLNQLIKSCQPGAVLTLSWLSTIGISHKLAGSMSSQNGYKELGKGPIKKFR